MGWISHYLQSTDGVIIVFQTHNPGIKSSLSSNLLKTKHAIFVRRDFRKVHLRQHKLSSLNPILIPFNPISCEPFEYEKYSLL